MPSELQKFIDERLTKVSKEAYEAIAEVVDEEAQQCFEEIRDGTPERTGGLRGSLTIDKVEDPTGSRYGYKIDYKGYNPQGIAYSYIGRSLNKGTSKIPGKKHIDKAVRKLKGMDERIGKKFTDKLNKK